MYNSYNPYYQQQRYQPMQQQPIQQMQPMQMDLNNMVQNRNVLNGKQVESLDVVKAIDIPLDGVSYFPLFDGSAIITKQIQMDGTSKTIIYKPFQDEKKIEPKYATVNDIESLEDKINGLKEQIKELKDIRKKSDK